MTAAKRAAGTGLPAGLAPPVKVALARAVTTMPRGAHPGTLLYEPKWDGYRAIGIRDDNGATLWSRQGKDLTRYSVGVKRRCADFGLMTVQFSVRDRCRTLA
jgi:ATP-dependent DNA ligase